MDLAAFEILLHYINATSARTEPVCGSLFQPVNDCVALGIEQESPAVAVKPAQHLRNIYTVYVRAVWL